MSKNYESTISIFEQTPMMDMCDTMDGLIISAVRRVGIDVNKEELVKALAYDRGQYEKGYEDALKEHGIIYCKDCVHNIEPEFGFCDRANHHVSLNSYCAT